MNRFVEFKDVDFSDQEHRAHPAYGSTGLRGFLSESRPSAAAASLGTATHILAFQSHMAHTIAEKPKFSGDVEEWMREAEEAPRAAVKRLLHWDGEPGIIHEPKFTGKGARTTQPAEFAAAHPDAIILPAKDYEKVHEVAEAIRLRDSGATILLPPSAIEMAHKMAESLCKCEGLQRLLEWKGAQRETTVLAKHSTGIWVKSRPDVRAQGRMPKVGSVRIIVDAKTTSCVDSDSFMRKAPDFGYDMQQSLYGDVDQDRHSMPCVRYIYAVRVIPSRDGEHKVLELKLPDSWVEQGRTRYTAALALAAVEEKTGKRPPFRWEVPHEVEPPPPWVCIESERMELYAQKVAAESGVEYPKDDQ